MNIFSAPQAEKISHQEPLKADASAFVHSQEEEAAELSTQTLSPRLGAGWPTHENVSADPPAHTLQGKGAERKV